MNKCKFIQMMEHDIKNIQNVTAWALEGVNSRDVHSVEWSGSSVWPLSGTLNRVVYGKLHP